MEIEKKAGFDASKPFVVPILSGGEKICEVRLLYRAITGALPFQGDWQEVLNRKQVEDPPNPKVLNREVPEDLNDICNGLLQRTPGLRADGSFILERLQCLDRKST